MSLTALEWGLRAPITPRFGGNLEALPRLQETEPKQQKKPTSNTKLRTDPSPERRVLRAASRQSTPSFPKLRCSHLLESGADIAALALRLPSRLHYSLTLIITKRYRAGVRTVQELLGHSDVSTTMICYPKRRF